MMYLVKSKLVLFMSFRNNKLEDQLKNVEGNLYSHNVMFTRCLIFIP